MRTKKLNVTLKGSDRDRGDVLLDDLQEFCAALTVCLRTCEKRVGAESRLDYRIVGLRRGSCSLTIQPTSGSSGEDDGTGADCGIEVIDLFDKTVRALESGKPLDSRLTCRDLKDFKRLARPYQGRVRSIRFGRLRITESYTTNIKKLLTQPAVAEGEATGTLERIDVHERSVFTLFPNIGGPVLCQFGEGLLDQVKAAVKRNVTVYGRLMYYLGSEFPGKARVYRIEVHPDDDDLPTLDDLRGMLANGAAHG